MTDVNALIRGVLEQQGRLPESSATLRDDEDLYASGLSSHASVNVMLALEDAFDVEFPDSMLRKSTFASIRSIRDALSSLGVVVDPG
jgi:acyl carrier protein